jgi:hypothetical protein
VLEVTVTNTGEAASTDTALHPADATAFLRNDVYRLSVAVEGEGWTAPLRNALVAIETGNSAALPVDVTRTPGAKPGRIVVTAVSESDPSQRALGARSSARCPRSAP